MLKDLVYCNFLIKLNNLEDISKDFLTEYIDNFIVKDQGDDIALQYVSHLMHGMYEKFDYKKIHDYMYRLLKDGFDILECEFDEDVLELIANTICVRIAYMNKLRFNEDKVLFDSVLKYVDGYQKYAESDDHTTFYCWYLLCMKLANIAVKDFYENIDFVGRVVKILNAYSGKENKIEFVGKGAM